MSTKKSITKILFRKKYHKNAMQNLHIKKEILFHSNIAFADTASHFCGFATLFLKVFRKNIFYKSC